MWLLYLYRDVLTQCRRIDVAMHDSRVGNKLGQFTRNAVIKTGSNSPNDVGLSHGTVCRNGENTDGFSSFPPICSMLGAFYWLFLWNFNK